MITPPTDSLYKFIAIAGVVMLLWGAAFPWNKAHELKIHSVEVRGQITAVGKKAENLKMQYQLLISELETVDPSDKDYKLKKQAIDTQKMKIYIQMVEAQNPVDVQIEKVQILDEAQHVYERIGWASVLGGLVFVIFGFFTWYIKIQRHLDKELSKK